MNYLSYLTKNFINNRQSGTNMQAKVCISTKKRIDNDEGAVTFLCPKCGDYEIVRSSFARVNGLKYTCPCGFEGPN